MTSLREAAQQALEAMESISDCYVGDDDDAGECASCHERSYKPHAPDCKKQNAITALRAALAQQEVPKGGGNLPPPLQAVPVLVVEKEPDYMSRGHFYEGSKPFIDPTLVWKLPIGTKLYTRPPRRETEQEPVACECHRCIKEKDLRDPSGMLPLNMSKMILCAECGNKRCPKASDHMLACTGSNEPGQSGSVYAHPPRREWQSLSEEEIDRWTPEIHSVIRAIEAKLKEKNNG